MPKQPRNEECRSYSSGPLQGCWISGLASKAMGTSPCKLLWLPSESPSSFLQDSLGGLTCLFLQNASCRQLGG